MSAPCSHYWTRTLETLKMYRFFENELHFNEMINFEEVTKHFHRAKLYKSITGIFMYTYIYLQQKETKRFAFKIERDFDMQRNVGV